MSDNTPANSDDEESSVPWISLASLGFATPFIFYNLAKGEPDKTYLKWAIAYGAAALLTVCSFGVLAPLLLFPWIGGSIHLFLIRDGHLPGKGKAISDSVKSMIESTTASADKDPVAEAKRLRTKARRTVASDPLLAKKMGIGRPDLDDRDADDGGLIDVNNAPAQAVETLPGISAQTAKDIVAHREAHGPFADADELIMSVSVNPKFEAQMREYTVFIP
ncbi:ComEA family DNA-binding protein [Salininema proteolyticum]|uniref:ComEA family DNA-binding protein n=1 Tax=Salininema proteolyticum TaxID=1607685 RepID=A0ABV8U1W2_9ACTN